MCIYGTPNLQPTKLEIQHDKLKFNLSNQNQLAKEIFCTYTEPPTHKENMKSGIVSQNIKNKTNTHLLLKSENNNKRSYNLQNQNVKLRAWRTFPITLITLVCF